MATEDLKLSDTEYKDDWDPNDYDKDTANLLVVDGLPIVPEAKFDALLGFVTKRFNKFGPVAHLHLGRDPETRGSGGFAFIEFVNKESVDAALAEPFFDTRHTLTQTRMADYETIMREPDTFSPPALAPYALNEDAYAWLADEVGRDEFCVRWKAGERDHAMKIVWADPRRGPVVDYEWNPDRADGRAWTTSNMMWSPQGTLLTTFHSQGVKLWWGTGFRDGPRLAHSRPLSAAFSPDERYLFTWNGHRDNATPERALVVWDTRTAREVKAFKQVHLGQDAPDAAWSHDSKHLVRLVRDPRTGEELVAVHSAPSFAITGRVRAARAQGLSLCPAGQALMAWWCPEKDQTPCAVQVSRVPSGEVIKSRTLFNVDSCELKWHPDGTYLAILAAKAVRKRKVKGPDGVVVELSAERGSEGYTIEVIRLKEKDMPSDVIEARSFVYDIAWEPSGHRLAILSGDSPAQATLSMYTLAREAAAAGKASGGKAAVPGAAKPAAPAPAAAPAAAPATGVAAVLGAAAAAASSLPATSTPMSSNATLLYALPPRAANRISWSPRGGHFVLAETSSGPLGGIEFLDADKGAKGVLCRREQYLTAVEWDPAGRIVIASKCVPHDREPESRDFSNNGYALYTFQGSEIARVSAGVLYQLSWRPRPAKILTDEELKEVKKNLKTYIERFTEADQRATTRAARLSTLSKWMEVYNFRSLLDLRRSQRPEPRFTLPPSRIIETERAETLIISDEVTEL